MSPHDVHATRSGELYDTFAIPPRRVTSGHVDCRREFRHFVCMLRTHVKVKNEISYATTNRGRLEYMSERLSRISQAACAVPSTIFRIIYKSIFCSEGEVELAGVGSHLLLGSSPSVTKPRVLEANTLTRRSFSKIGF